LENVRVEFTSRPVRASEYVPVKDAEEQVPPPICVCARTGDAVKHKTQAVITPKIFTCSSSSSDRINPEADAGVAIQLPKKRRTSQFR
jgi:hypothetical protein